LALLLPLYACAAAYTIHVVRWASQRERASVAAAVLLMTLPASAISRWVRAQSPEIQHAIAAKAPERESAAARLLASSRPGTTLVFGELKQWSLINARVAEDGSAVLVSDGNQASILQHPVALEKDVTYRVEFEASSPFNGGSVSVDLYGGPDYDSPAQNSILTSFDTVYKTVTYTWNSGANAPDSAFLRFVSISPHPVQVRNVKFVKVN
jgi:hypothetical protein